MNNPFLSSKNIADNPSTQNKDIKNPFIEEKIKADTIKKRKQRKSILFYEEDYEKIVALSKTKGKTIIGYLTSLVESDLDQLNRDDKARYEKFSESQK